MRFATVLAAASLFWVPASPAQPAPPPWPTYAFEVQYGSGGLVDSIASLFNGDEQAALAGQVKVIEDYLSDAARALQKMGFRAPPMTRGDRGYIVNLFDYGDDQAYAQAGLVGDTCVFRLDLSRAFVRGRMESRLLENVGHELFHCVQSAYPMFGLGLAPQSWITEATAQAIGQDLLWHLRGQEYPRNNPGQRWGGRAYQLPLALRDDRLPKANFHYYTESFWRYLAEHAAAKKRGGRAGAEPPPAKQPPDYSYLHELFLTVPSGRNEAAELTWADIGLEAVFGAGLDRLYPEFVSTFAAYVPPRVGASSTPPEKMAEGWTKLVFGGCKSLELGMSQPVVDVRLDLAPLASRCIRLGSDITDQVDVTIHAHADSMRTLRSLVIGTAGGDRVAQPVIFGPPAGGGIMGYWTFRLGMDPAQVLIVTNVLEDAAETRAQNVSLKVSVNGWLSSATEPDPEAPAAQAARARPKAPRGAAPDATRQGAEARVATGLDSLSAYAINGLEVAFNHDEPPCSEPFVLAACGPNTQVNLSLAPGSVGGFAHASGTGGSLAHFMTTLTAVGDHGIERANAEMEAAAQAIAETKGSTVTIVMPAIDYGFTGSMDGVLIHVNGEGGDELQAIGPQDTRPGPGWMFPQSGQVTIEEFTPFALRGRFSAPVVNVTRVNWENIGEDPVLDVSEVVTGSFVISAPWRGDPRAVMLQTENTVELATQDLAAIMPLPGSGVDGSMRSPVPSEAEFATGYAVQPISALPRCDCSCAPLEPLSPACRPICGPALNHCGATESVRRDAARGFEREAALVEASGGLRERFDAHMQATNADPDFRAAMLEAFDRMGSAREQRNFVRSMGMPLEQTEAEVDPNLERILRMTREEYIDELEATNVPAALHPELLEIFDEYQRRGGNR